MEAVSGRAMPPKTPLPRRPMRHVRITAIERALQLDFLERAENLVLVATQGLGKTMIAQNLAHAAVLGGASALFITAVISDN